MRPLLLAAFLLAAPAGAAEPRLVPFALSGLNAESLLTSDLRVRLHAFGERPEDYRGEAPALVLVHGLGGRLEVLQGVVDRFRDSRFQLYLLAYDSRGLGATRIGDEFARELLVLARESRGARRELAIVAHSLGGIVTRRALNVLAAGGEEGLGAFRRVRVVAVDSPWHGISGPMGIIHSDPVHRDLVAPHVPLAELAERSPLFRGGDPAGMDELPRGLLTTPLPSHVRIDLVFAQEGELVLDYTEGALAVLPERLVRHFRFEEPVAREAAVRNFWDALIWSRAFPDFHDDLSRAAAAASLDRAGALAALRRHYPRYPGDHNGVLSRTGPGSLLEDLPGRLGR